LTCDLCYQIPFRFFNH